MIDIVVLISGNGSNLQAIIDATRGMSADGNQQSEKLQANIKAVISNNADAYGLQRAGLAGLPTEVLDHRQYADRQAYDADLQTLIDRYKPDLVVLAGFMRIFSEAFVNHYPGRMINIHPSLLPRFPGLDTHRRALESGDSEHGASVHFVTPEVDGGPVIAQASVPVREEDTIETLKNRVHEQEHRIYPRVIQWFAEKRLYLKENTAYLDGQPLPEPVRL